MKRRAKSAAPSLLDKDAGPGRVPDSRSLLPDTFTRTMAGRITSWPPGMERRYGFSRDQAMGTISHELLNTVFPVALQDIEATLLAADSWHGGLIHHHADGRAIVVMGHWRVTSRASAIVVTETHSDTISAQFADLLAMLANELSQPLTAISNYVHGTRRSLQRDRPDQDSMRRAMTLAAAQIARSADQVKLLRSLAANLRDGA